jgi:hypothetical protein
LSRRVIALFFGRTCAEAATDEAECCRRICDADIYGSFIKAEFSAVKSSEEGQLNGMWDHAEHQMKRRSAL